MAIATHSKPQRHVKTRQSWTTALFVVFVLLSFLALIEASAQEFKSSPNNFSSRISLSELPKIKSEVLAAQNNRLSINDPIPYDSSKGVGQFEIEILSGKNFKDKSPVSFAGDAESLNLFLSEVAYVNSGAAYGQQVYDPAKHVVEKMVKGLLDFDLPSGTDVYAWIKTNLTKEGIEKAKESIRKNVDGIKQLGKFIRNSSSDDLSEDLKAIAHVIRLDTASRLAAEKGLNFFELKTPEAVLSIEKEVATFLTATAVVTAAKLAIERYVGKRIPIPNVPVKQIQEFVNQRKHLPNPSSIEKLARVEALFPETAKKLNQSIQKSNLHGPVVRTSLPSGSNVQSSGSVLGTTGGSSLVLGQNIGIPKTGGWAAHHIIPSELKDHRALRKVGMNMDEASNGIALPTRPGLHPNLPLHAGSHPSYTKAISKQLDQIPDNLSVTETQNRIREVQQTFQKLLESGRPLHMKYGAQDPWIP